MKSGRWESGRSHESLCRVVERKNPTKRSTWGEPVASFIREASIVRSGDNLTTGTFIFSASPISSNIINLIGIQFDFANLIPRGMTCFEWGQNGSSWAAGNGLAIGDASGGGGR